MSFTSAPGAANRTAAGFPTASSPICCPANLKENHFTHVEFLPIMEHPFDGSWGYQVSGYFSPTSRYGEPDDLRFLVNTLHEAGIGVLFDFVPAHFVVNDYALANFDGTQAL